jgi:hypothetical protein
MSASLTQPQTKPQVLTKHSYFSSGKKLYFIVDAMSDGDYFLVEDCSTNESRWWSLQEFMRVKKRRVEFISERRC